jgi:hypothetical protein
MTTEAAYAKMSFLFGLNDDAAWVREMMVKPLAGEIAEEEDGS